MMYLIGLTCAFTLIASLIAISATMRSSQISREEESREI